MERYYLNNISESEVTINLSTSRTIKPMTSLPLNTKDIEIYKSLKLKRKGIPSVLDNLAFSTIPIERDSRYIQAMQELNIQDKEAQEKAEAEKKAKEEQEKAEAEKKAEEERLAKEKEAQEKADAELKEKLRKAIVKQAKKDKRTFAEGDLEKEVEEAFAKVKAEQVEG